VTVLTLSGKLDASNYEQVIARGRELYAGGVRRLLLDLGGLSFMGSSGLVALHTITLLLLGEPAPDPEAGWAALHALDSGHSGEPQDAVKLLNPQPKIRQMLELTGMDAYYAIFTDRAAALASFG
jgi:anti-anti-sigma regulatory factor